MSISFSKLGKFSFIIFSNRFPISCSFSSPSGTPMVLMLGCFWSCPTDCLHYPHFFGFFFSSCSSHWLFFASLCSKSLIWFLASSTLLLLPYKLFFISISESFISDWIFFMLLRSSLISLSILITVFQARKPTEIIPLWQDMCAPLKWCNTSVRVLISSTGEEKSEV